MDALIAKLKSFSENYYFKNKYPIVLKSFLE